MVSVMLKGERPGLNPWAFPFAMQSAYLIVHCWALVPLQV